MSPKIVGVLHIISNLEQMVHFFTQVLEFKERERTPWSGEGTLVKLSLGDQWNYLLSFPSRPLYPADTRSHDAWFQHIAIVVSDIDKAFERLKHHRTQLISPTPQNVGGVRALYFRSPDGHPLELIQYPKGYGSPSWQDRRSLFLGIDHTAITVKSTEKSVRFYCDLFGMKVLQEGLNHGEAQESLTGVKGARVKITTLGFPDSSSMQLECLEYLAPSGGRDKGNLLAESYTVIAVEELASFSEKLPADKKVFPEGILITDPDGHRVFLRDVP